MFILIICCPLLILSLIWHKFTESSHCFLRCFLLIVISLYFASFYLNGVDWSIYYLKFLEDDNPYQSFEFGFVMFFKTLLFISGNNFGVAIVLFYLLVFGCLLSILKKYKTNDPLLLLSLFLIFGYTLMLEQLRQFIACVIIFYAILKYNENYSIKSVVVWILLASCFHASSLILLPALALTSIKNVDSFICLTLMSICGMVIFLFSGYVIIDALSGVSFVFQKILLYFELNPIEIRFRLLNILDVVFILFYVILRYRIDKKGDIRILTRILFIGSVIHMFSGSVLFLDRVTFFFYFIAVYLFCMTLNKQEKRVYSIRSNNTLILNIYFTLFLVVNFTSYFRNEYAPVIFQNMNYRIISLFDSEHVYNLALDTYSEAMVDIINK